jgi:hypothetical protein
MEQWSDPDLGENIPDPQHWSSLLITVRKNEFILQEILRVHGRAARALANQSLPYSVCTILRDEEIYTPIDPNQEEKNRDIRSRFVPEPFRVQLLRLFFSGGRVGIHFCSCCFRNFVKSFFFYGDTPVLILIRLRLIRHTTGKN